MLKYKVILFDLDGTISDPKIGITKSVQFALQKMDIYEPDIHKLECFIGPPLQVSFAEYYDFNERKIQKAIDFYRERFKEKALLMLNVDFETLLIEEEGGDSCGRSVSR